MRVKCIFSDHPKYERAAPIIGKEYNVKSTMTTIMFRDWYGENTLFYSLIPDSTDDKAFDIWQCAALFEEVKDDIKENDLSELFEEKLKKERNDLSGKGDTP